MRLWGGGRAKGTEQRTAAVRSPIAEAVLPDRLEVPQAPAAEHLLGLLPTAAEEEPSPGAEWGFYDPDVAGFSALLATLDTSAIPSTGEVEESPGELLLRQEIPPVRASAAAIEIATSGDDWNTRPASPAAAAVASCAVGHLAPLALWARLGESEAPGSATAEADRVGWLLSHRGPTVASPRDGQLFGADLASAIGRPAHPAYLARTGLPAACRIHHVHVAPVAEVAPEPAEPPSWPLPSVVSVPHAIYFELPPEPDAECPVMVDAVACQDSDDGTGTTGVAVDIAGVPPGCGGDSPLDDAAPIDLAINAGVGVEVGDDVADMAIEPPALDSLPVDLIADLPSDIDVAAGEVEDDLATAEPAAVEPVGLVEASQPSLPEVPDVAGVPSAAAAVADDVEPVQEGDNLPLAVVVAAADGEPALDEVQAPAVQPIPVPVSAPRPVRAKRRRAALALG